jgi:hypothetical protein
VLSDTNNTLIVTGEFMLKPPLWVEPPEDWREHRGRFVGHFTCGCGREGCLFVAEKAESLDFLFCRRCRRKEHNRLAMRQRRGSAEPYKPRPCAHCGERFTPERSTGRYCGARCRVAAHRANATL